MTFLRSTRRAIVVTILVAASALISQWRPEPSTPHIVMTAANVIPPMFTKTLAVAPPTAVGGCTGTPVSPTGQLSITLKSIQLIDTNDAVSPSLGSGTLDFAASSGATVGNFVSEATMASGMYKA